MTTKAIAKQLVTLCRKAQWEKAQRKLYARNAVSLEAEEAPGFPKETKGLKAIFAKGLLFAEMIEKMHKLEVSDAVVADHSFSCTMTMDVDMKGMGRVKMAELCVYQVKKGKIVSEQFFN